MSAPPPDRIVTLAGGRRIALDDRGDPAGAPVLYLHGTPDSRLARHPDDSIAMRCGVRLLALDRPGVGASDADAGATPSSVARDITEILDALGITRANVLAWSAGAIFALALAGAHPVRVGNLVLAAPLVPADAYGDETVLEGADDTRRLFVESLGSMPPEEIGRELAMWLVPPEVDRATAEAMLQSSLAAVAGIPGAAEQLILALQASVESGMTGIERDLVAQATILGDMLDRIAAPTVVHVGSNDTVAPPAMGRWIARRTGVAAQVHEGEGHALAITRWEELLVSARG